MPSPHAPSSPLLPQPASLGEYLRSARELLPKRLLRPRPPPSETPPQEEPLLVLVMGNDAGDLDSVVSAVSLAYLITHFGFGRRPRQGDFPIDPDHDPWSSPASPPHSSSRPVIAVPVIQTEQQNAKLRPENTLFLETVLAEQYDELVWLDQFLSWLKGEDSATTWRLAPENHVAFALVDHNRLAPRWMNNVSRTVYTIIDHHQDEGAHEESLLRVVEGPESSYSAGSCASLVTIVYSEELSQQKDTSLPGALASVGALLLGPILLDTKGLKPLLKGGKATHWDEVAVQILFSHAAQSSPATEDAARKAIEEWSLLVWDLLASGGIHKGSLPQEAHIVSPVGQTIASDAPLDLNAQVQALKPGWTTLKKAKASASFVLTPMELLRRDCKVTEVDIRKVDGKENNGTKIRLALATLPTSVPSLVYDRFQMFPLDPEEHTEAWKRWWGTLAEFATEMRVILVLGLCSSSVSVASTPEAQLHTDTKVAVSAPQFEVHQGNGTTLPELDPGMHSVKGNSTLTSFSEADERESEGVKGQKSKKKGKSEKIRELVVLALGPSPSEAEAMLRTLSHPLERNDQNNPDISLGLQLPWSYPLPQASQAQLLSWLAGRRPEDWSAFDHLAGLSTLGSAHFAEGGGLAAKVYRQLNNKANRKVVMPKVLDALEG